jgi:steroid delta-isomerase-like uncharacterized protein
MAIDNVNLARRWFEEVWNQKRTDIIDELLTEESVSHSESGTVRGKAEFLQRVHSVFLAAFPDLWITVEGTVAEGDDVVVRWSATGTHEGDSLGFPATGRNVAFRGMTLIRYRDGKMAEGWDCWNLAGLIQSLKENNGGSESIPPAVLRSGPHETTLLDRGRGRPLRGRVRCAGPSRGTVPGASGGQSAV